MHFSSLTAFEARPTEVVAAMVDPDCYLDLELPDVALPELVSHRVGDGHGLLVLRYAYLGQLDGLARRLVGDGPLRWRQEVAVDLTAATGTLTVRSEDAAGRLRADATISFSPLATGSLRRVEGALVVALPVIGGVAERAIVPGVLDRLEREAAALNARLSGAGGALSR